MLWEFKEKKPSSRSGLKQSGEEKGSEMKMLKVQEFCERGRSVVNNEEQRDISSPFQQL